MSSSQQEQWLSDTSFVDMEGRRPVDEDLRRKYQGRFKLFERKVYTQEVITVLREYVRIGIPAIKRGEISFWSCTCLPGTRPRDSGIQEFCARINVGWQEVFVIYYESNKRLSFAWQVARSSLKAALRNPLWRLKWRNLEIVNFVYPSGGSDQIRLQITGTDAIRSILQDEKIQQAIRLLNLRLMRKGPCTFGRYHCLDLADKILEFDQIVQ